MISANETISRNLKRIRQERNLTLDDLAILTSVSKSMLSEIERFTFKLLHFDVKNTEHESIADTVKSL